MSAAEKQEERVISLARRRIAAHSALAVLATEQGVGVIHSVDEIRGDFWPESESVDEFLAARRRWHDTGVQADRSAA